jgi:hypothetical protein
MGVSEYHGRTIVRHHLIPAALAASGSVLLLASTATAATPAWTVVHAANPAGAGLNAVSARTASDAWAVGNGFNNVHDTSATNANQAVIEHWNGTAWSVVASPNGSAGDTLLGGVSALPSGEAWAAGTVGSATTGGGAFVIHHTP